MTEDEKRQQKAMLLLEHQEAEQELAHLREKASRMLNAFQAVSGWISDQRFEKGRIVSDQDRRNRDSEIRAKFHEYKPLINLDDVLKLVDEIHQAEGRVETLKQRKQSLGLT